MPQRRAFAPNPANQPEQIPHGRQASPPNLSPAPKPLPPPQPAQPTGQALSSPSPYGAPSPSAGAGTGTGSGQSPLPSSIPLRPPAPAQPAQPGMMGQPPAPPSPIGDGTVTPFNAGKFINAQSGMASGQSQGPIDDPSALLKLLGRIGPTGDIEDGMAGPMMGPLAGHNAYS